MTFSFQKIFSILLLFVIYSLQSKPILSVDADALMPEAESAIQKGEYQKSAALLQVILEENPNNLKALELLEKSFDIKVQRQNIEDQLVKSIKGKNLPLAQLHLKQLQQKDPFNRNLGEYIEAVKKLEEEEKFSTKRLNLSRNQEKERDDLLKKAERAMKEKRHLDALKLYQRLLELAPGDLIAKSGIEEAQRVLEEIQEKRRIRLLLTQGEKEFNERKLLSAKDTFEKILVLEPRHKVTINWLEKIDLALKEKRENENKSIQADVYYKEGKNFFQNREYEKAIYAWENTLTLIPDYRDTHARIRKAKALKEKEWLKEERDNAYKIEKLIQKGLVAYYSEDFESAISFLGQAVKIDPNNKYVRNTLELARDGQKLKSEEEVDENSPFFPLVRTLERKAKNLFNRRKYRKAKKEWSEILLLFPKNRLALRESLRCDSKLNPEVFRLAAKKIIEEGKRLLSGRSFKSARRKFLIIKEIDKNFPGIDALLARTQKYEKKSRMAKLPRPTLKNYYNKGLKYYRAGKLAQARDWFQKVVDNDPVDFQAIASLSKVKKLLAIGKGFGKEKKGYLTKKQRLNVKRLYIFGLTQYSNNNYRKAINAWRKVLGIDPKHREARSNIARVQKLLKS